MSCKIVLIVRKSEVFSVVRKDKVVLVELKGCHVRKGNIFFVWKGEVRRKSEVILVVWKVEIILVVLTGEVVLVMWKG